MTSTPAKSLPIVPLPHVGDQFLARMYGDFEDSVSGRIAELKAETSWQSAEKIKFFEYLLDRVDRAAFRALRDAHLSPPSMVSGALKYLDPVSWFDDKFEHAFRLGLHEKPPMRILDIGTGPGHFLVIAQFYGHDTLGTEIPDHRTADRPTHLYNSLSTIFGTRRIKNRISPMQPLDELGGPYDLVTSFLAAFNRAQGGHIWNTQDWDYFLTCMRKQVLAEDGEFFLEMVQRKRSDEVWNHLARMSEWNDPERLLLKLRAAALPA